MRNIRFRAARIADGLTDEELAMAVTELVKEIASRPSESRERELEIAQAVWPDLRDSLRSAGRRISSVAWDGPRLVTWCFYPVLPCEGYHGRKPKTKAAALERAVAFGIGWATVAECWMWVQGGGPVVERAMHAMGFGGNKPAPLSPSEMYPWPPRPAMFQNETQHI